MTQHPQKNGVKIEGEKKSKSFFLVVLDADGIKP